jgi:ATP-dependent Clp protease ATP-binding subunit ClpC
MEKVNYQTIYCPDCNGTGRIERKKCPKCSGNGVSIFENGKFFYWGKETSQEEIVLKRMQKKVNLFLNLIIFVVGLGGVFSLAYWLWLNGWSSGNFAIAPFWSIRHPLLLFFWTSLAADMFIYYRLSEEAQEKEKIKRPKVDDEKNIQFPNTWEELSKASKKYRWEISKGFSSPAEKVIEDGFLLAGQYGQEEVGTMHLFIALLKDREIVSLFARLGIGTGDLSERLEKRLGLRTAVLKKIYFANEVKEILIRSYLDARRNGQKQVRPVNLIIPILEFDKIISEYLFDLGIDNDKAANVVKWFTNNEKQVENYKLFRRMSRFKPDSAMNRSYTALATPALNHFGYDLTLAAKWGRLEYCVEREEEIEKIFHYFESGQYGVMLVGPVGIGKKTIIHGIAQMMVEENVPKMFRDKRLVELDAARLVSGGTATEIEERMLTILDEISRAGNIILFMENIESISGIRAGTEESLDLSDVLANGIRRGLIYCLATVNNQSYARHIEGRPLGNALAAHKIPEPTGNLAIRIIESKIAYFEAKYKVYYSYKAIETAVEKAKRYIHDENLPTKAINILELAGVKVAKYKQDFKFVSDQDVAEVISEKTGIPVTNVSESEGNKLLNLEKEIHEHMIGQEEAVSVISASLRRARAEMREGKRPIANFLFLGPTGVGKTELAKTVALVYFGSEKNMIRIDMSEYQNSDSINKMIGDPNGSLGYLTEAVRKMPFSLVLLDEFEKAHADIHNLFLQVFDDGRLTDGQGRTIDFTNSIIIATSNSEAVFIQEQIKAGADIEKIKTELINERLNKVLRPELINRFDGIIVFKPLTISDIIEITKLILEKIGKMLEEKGIHLKADEQGIARLAGLGYDPQYGARPLRRIVQDKIENEIANKFLSGDLERRDTVVINANADIEVEKGKEL